MKKNTVVAQSDYLGRLLTEDQEERWIEMSNDCDTKYAFIGEKKSEQKNLLTVLYAKVVNCQATLERNQRAQRRKEKSGGRRNRNSPRKHDARKREGDARNARKTYTHKARD